ncbi:MAG: CYTH domain-containing protein [Muribaculaceae bacterium]|nr:CYTH domain-containing protein [Muribaculaceae bacterium]
MAKEIERKYLVKSNDYQTLAEKKLDITQGYLSRKVEATVRVRIINDKAFITIKGQNNGIVRNEWEYEIPIADGREMLALCKGTVINKVRYIVSYEGMIWEIDEFLYPNPGLVVAEVELPSAEDEPPLPSFIGEEVTGNPEYYNSNM